MNLLTTFKTIRSFKPCSDGWLELGSKYCALDHNSEPLDRIVSLLGILESNGVEDAFWALRCWDYKVYCGLLADVIKPIIDRARECEGYPGGLGYYVDQVWNAMQAYSEGEAAKEYLIMRRNDLKALDTSKFSYNIIEFVEFILLVSNVEFPNWTGLKAYSRGAILQAFYFNDWSCEQERHTEKCLRKYIKEVK